MMNLISRTNPTFNTAVVRWSTTPQQEQRHDGVTLSPQALAALQGQGPGVRDQQNGDGQLEGPGDKRCKSHERYLKLAKRFLEGAGLRGRKLRLAIDFCKSILRHCGNPLDLMEVLNKFKTDSAYKNNPDKIYMGLMRIENYVLDHRGKRIPVGQLLD